MPTGGKTFVLDIDRGHADGADGFATLKDNGWVLPTTRIHHTPSGGVHAFFRVPEGMAIKSSAGKIGPGLDIRGDGAYVVRWDVQGNKVENSKTIADTPSFLLTRLGEIGSIVRTGTTTPATAGTAPTNALPSAIAGVRNEDLGGGPLGLSASEITATLSKLDPNMGYNDWVKVGQALHHETSGALAGLDAWVAWSTPSDKFPGSEELATKWASFGKFTGEPATVRSILRMARDTPSADGPDHATSQTRRYPYADGVFTVGSDGVVFVSKDADGLPHKLWICSPLYVKAKTRDARSGEWGRLLEWRDDDGHAHQWAMPLELLQADGVDIRRELARLGLTIAPGKKARDLLAAYLQVAQVENRARCVERLGWHGGVYVTPTDAIGAADEIVVYQNAHALEPALAAAGTVDQWRDSVARLATGNSRLVFALSLALAAPLAEVVGEDSGGFHFRGSSSTGKTTALHVAASVWGVPKTYARTWRSTVNGLESLAALHNDGLLILDELSQCDPREVGEAAYLLANGQGKSRASRNGSARQAARWRLLFLSAGEEALASLMSRAGQRTNAGQEVRLADIHADAGAGLGLFEVLHDQSTPAALALALKDATAKYHGAVGVEWLRYIVAGRAQLVDRIASGIQRFVDGVAPPDAAGQVLRVARRFALVAMAGELATGLRLTGWNKREAEAAARKCFTAWLDAFGGGGNREARAILSHVRGFFEAHGQSRFALLDDTLAGNRTIINRAGFVRRMADGAREFLVLPEAYRRELCMGFDQKTVTRTLVDAGWLIPPPTRDQHTAQRISIAGMGRPRVYVFSACIWEADE